MASVQKAMRTWVRKKIDVSELPRIKLNNLKDLPGAKKEVLVDDEMR